MSLARLLKYWFFGGRRRWLRRQAARLPKLLEESAGPPRSTLGAALLEALTVGLEISPTQALALAQRCEPQMSEACGTADLRPRMDALLTSVAERTSGPAAGYAWRLGWLLARRAGQPADLTRFARGLALHHARAENAEELSTHLRSCRAADALDQATFELVCQVVDRSQPMSTSAVWRACESECHEHLGDVRAALEVCPPSLATRRLELLDRLQHEALTRARAGELAAAMVELSRLRALVTSEPRPGIDWLERRGTLERHRRHLLDAGRRELLAKVPAQPPEQRRDALLACIAFEEAAEDWSAAALLLEQTGELADRLRASQLWEKDERYGEAVRSLGPLAERRDAQFRTAQLRERGGDAAGAALLYEHLQCWGEAETAHRAAGQWAQAARCFRSAHGDLEAACSVDYGRLMEQGGQLEELLELCLQQLEQAPGHQPLRARLRGILRDHAHALQSSRLCETAQQRVAASVRGDLRPAFEREAPTWIEATHQALRARFGHVWGMDLGTSKCAVALFDTERNTAAICPHLGQPHFASTLSLDHQGNELIGLDALAQLRPDLRGCIERSKRAMGTRRRYKIGERFFSPEEVAARLLTHGRLLVEEFLRAQARDLILARALRQWGEDFPAEWLDEPKWAARLSPPMREAVITIPAYFNFDQRRATRDAAEIAGIKVHRLIPEPTAACLSAALTRQLPGKVLVVDLGAGTLDLSYLEATYVDQGECLFEVEQVFGDNQFGASDFDQLLEQHFLSRLKERGVPDPGGTDRRRLHAAAEQIKISLSTSPRATYELISFAGQASVTLELTAAELETLLAPLLDRLEQICQKAANLHVDRLVLVGGPMLSPLVRRRIEQVLQRKADAVMDPRTQVATGAAYQAALLSHRANVPFLLLDIVPFALGVLVKPRPAADGAPTEERVSFHIPRGTRIPHENRRPYTTTEDHQTGVTVQVFQGLGESSAPADNSRLAVIHLEGLPPAKAGEPRIDVTFEVDCNGLLEVTAKDERTGKSKSVRIEDAIWLSPAERTTMTKRLDEQLHRAKERDELVALGRRVTAALEEALQLARRGDAAAWRQQFTIWQQRPGGPVVSGLTPSDEAQLAEMYRQGALVCDQLQISTDRLHNLQPTCQRFVDAVEQLPLADGAPRSDQRPEALRAQGLQLEGELRDGFATLQALAARLRGWTAVLLHGNTARADPRDRILAFHEAGDWTRAADAYQQAFGALPCSEVPLPLLHRHLDTLAHLRQRERYREVFAEAGTRLARRALHVDRLNEFGRQVRAAMAWVHCGTSGTGSGFLAAPHLVVTNRHVVCEDGTPLSHGDLKVQVGGTPYSVVHMRFPADPEIDLAVLELAQACDAPPVRIGYSQLVEVGERVVAMGFPLPKGDSFEENLLMDHGIVNRIRAVAGHGRELELGLRLAPGMSGGPIFNDCGEVVAVSAFVRYLAAHADKSPFFEKTAHAIAVDALHPLLPKPWG